MPVLSEGPMCKQAPSCSRAQAGYKCQELVTVAVNTRSRTAELGNLPRHFWLIQVTGKVQPPRLAVDYWSIIAAVEAESTSELCEGPSKGTVEGYCKCQQNEPLWKGVLNTLCIKHPVLAKHCSRLLLQEHICCPGIRIYKDGDKKSFLTSL